MRSRIILFYVLCLMFYTLVGCEKFNIFPLKKTTKVSKSTVPLSVKGTAIAKVNNLPITLEELNREIDVYNASIDLRRDLSDEAKKSLKIDTREKKIGYLKEEMVRRMVFYQAALDRGLERKEDITAILERNKIAILSSEMQSEVIKNIEVSSAEVEEAYKTIKDQLREPETRKIREIVTRTEEEARSILIELLQGADFSAMAKTRSSAESAKNAGLLGDMKQGERGEQFLSFDAVAFSPALQMGSVSSIFKGPEGYYIVKIEEIKEGKQPTLTEVWDELKYRLLLRKQQEELDKAYSQLSGEAKIKIEIYEGEIK